MDRLAVQSLDQGMFAFPRPKVIHIIGYIITLSSVLTAYTLYSQSLGIPDVPRVEEATVLPYLHDDVSAYDLAPVQRDTMVVNTPRRRRSLSCLWNWKKASSPPMIAGGLRTMKETGVGNTASRWLMHNV